MAPVKSPAESWLFSERSRLLMGFREFLGDEIQVDQMINESLDEIRPAVLVVEIIGVLPNVTGQERGLTFGQWIDRIRCRSDLELAAFCDEPAPTAAELADRGGFELLLELVGPAAVAVHRRGGPTPR